MILDFKVSKKMPIKNILIIIIFILINIVLYSQTNEVFVYDKMNLSNAYMYYNAKNYLKAIEFFEYEIENSPIIKIEYFENLANAYLNLRDYSNMLRVSRSGILVNRFSPKLYFQKGYALYRLGETNKAIDSIRHSIVLKPNDAYINNFLGLLYLYVEDYKQAEASFLKANVYSPSNVVYMVNLGATYERDRNFTYALNIYEQAYKLDPKYRGLAESINRTKTILGINSNNNLINILEDTNNLEYDDSIEAKPIETYIYDNIVTNITDSIITNFGNTNYQDTNTNIYYTTNE